MGNCERIFVIWDLYISFHLLVLLFTQHWQTGALPRLPPSGSLTERRTGGIYSASELASVSSCGSGNCDHCPCDSGPFLLSRLASAVSPLTPPLFACSLSSASCAKGTPLPPASIPNTVLDLELCVSCFVLLTAATPLLLYA